MLIIMTTSRGNHRHTRYLVRALSQEEARGLPFAALSRSLHSPPPLASIAVTIKKHRANPNIMRVRKKKRDVAFFKGNSIRE